MESVMKPQSPGRAVCSVVFSYWSFAVIITAIRIVTLLMSPANLGMDESQYWYWSQNLSAGYFSKPPLIAWIISASTAVFGNAEWAVRLPAPLFHFGTAAFVYMTAKVFFDERAAFWAGLGWITMPGVSLSSFVMATDAPLLFFWSGSLYLLAGIISGRQRPLFAYPALGMMTGAGLLSKYAMIFFPAGLAAALVLVPSLRKAVSLSGLAFSGCLALMIAMPNIAWNIRNGFLTFLHTGANTNWSGAVFSPGGTVRFLLDQAGVAGPFIIILSVMLLWSFLKGKSVYFPPGDRIPALWKTFFILGMTPLLIIGIQAFISRAHANWAATAYPAIIVLVSGLAFRYGAGRLVRAGVLFNTALAFTFCIFIVNLPLLDRLGLSHIARELEGWEELTDSITETYENMPGLDAVSAGHRSIVSAMLYYQRDRDIDIVSLDQDGKTGNHFEAFLPVDPDVHANMLFVSVSGDDRYIREQYETVRYIGKTRGGSGSNARVYSLFFISGFHEKPE